MSTFPKDIVETIKTRAGEIDTATPFIDSSTKLTVVTRLVRPSGDPNATLGVYAHDWSPFDQESGFIGVSEPMGSYTLILSTLIKNSKEEPGREVSEQLVKSIRLLMYRDNTLQVRLRQLSETVSGLTESVSRTRVQKQRYIDEQSKNGAFLFMSATQVLVETQIT